MCGSLFSFQLIFRAVSLLDTDFVSSNLLRAASEPSLIAGLIEEYFNNELKAVFLKRR